MTLHAELEQQLRENLAMPPRRRRLPRSCWRRRCPGAPPVIAAGADHHRARLHLRQPHAAQWQSRAGSGERSAGRHRRRAASSAPGRVSSRNGKSPRRWAIACRAIMLTAINPGRDARGEPVYLSTSGVLEEIARLAEPQSLGCVGVVAFADHLYRCVATARRLGFDAHAPDGVGNADHLRSAVRPGVVPRSHRLPAARYHDPHHRAPRRGRGRDVAVASGPSRTTMRIGLCCPACTQFGTTGKARRMRS